MATFAGVLVTDLFWTLHKASRQIDPAANPLLMAVLDVAWIREAKTEM